LNGLLILDKPGGMTSHDVVARARRILGESSIGHLGTLDPMATGVLPLLLGKFTRLAQYFGDAQKIYTGTIRFGFATDTYDAEGSPAGPVAAFHGSLDEVRTQAAHFRGELDQMPPPFSAKKVGGTPAYKLARAGKEVTLTPKRIVIDCFEIETLRGDSADFRMAISAGGYVRSVAHELGQRLGCGAHLAGLRRIQAGPFLIEDAQTFETVENAVRAGSLENAMPHPRTLLPEMPAVTADAVTVGRLRNGMAVNLPDFSNAQLAKIFEGQERLVAIGRRIAGTLFQPVTVLA
jgi:tRNA pseudouridine55 synthase